MYQDPSGPILGYVPHASCTHSIPILVSSTTLFCPIWEMGFLVPRAVLDGRCKWSTKTGEAPSVQPVIIHSTQAFWLEFTRDSIAMCEAADGPSIFPSSSRGQERCGIGYRNHEHELPHVAMRLAHVARGVQNWKKDTRCRPFV